MFPMTNVAAAQREIALWREDYRRFVVNELHVTELDSFQEEALLAASGEEMKAIPRICLKASKGPGKTATLAWIGLASMATRVNLRGACISITGDNLRDNLWAELAKWQNRSEFLKNAFTWTKTRFYANDAEATWWLSFRTWPKNGSAQEQEDALAGLHEDNVLVLADETGAYPSSVMATADAVLSSCKWGLVVQAGNPTHLEGPLYEAVTKHRNQWVVITINGDPDNPKRAKRVSEKWAREQIEKYGKDNPFVLVNVFGEFPPASINALLGVPEVEAAFARYGAVMEQSANYAQKRIGCDTARFGDDPNVFFPRQGFLALNPVEMRNERGPELAARVILMKHRWQGVPIVFVDDTGGYGATLLDSMYTAGHPAIPINFGSKAVDPRFANKRAEMWWNMAEWIKTRGALPAEVMAMLIPELTQVHYTFTKRSQLIIEDKDEIKAVLGRSPNYADALALTFALPESPDLHFEDGSMLAAAGNAGHYETEWDAFHD
jgi:phage terminase large subunit